MKDRINKAQRALVQSLGPDCVRQQSAAQPVLDVWLHTEHKASPIIRIAREQQLPLYLASERLNRDAVECGLVLHLDPLSQILEFQERNHLVLTKVGITVGKLEQVVRNKGFSVGFDPEDPTTVAEALMLRAALWSSPRFGTLDDICVSVAGVLPDGTVVKTRTAPRRATGPDPRQFFLGGGGRFGLPVTATLKVRSQPGSMGLVGFSFEDLAAALDCARQIVQREMRPYGLGVSYGGRQPTMLVLVPEGPEREAIESIAAASGRRVSDAGGGLQDMASRLRRCLVGGVPVLWRNLSVSVKRLEHLGAEHDLLFTQITRHGSNVWSAEASIRQQLHAAFEEPGAAALGLEEMVADLLDSYGILKDFV